MRHVLGCALVMLVACDKASLDKATSEPTTEPAVSRATAPAASAWVDFEGIQYRAPEGTSMNVQDGVLPGPGGHGGIPSGEHIEASIAKSGAFYVQLVRRLIPMTLEGTKQALVANQVGRDLHDTTTRTGWELTYEQLDRSGTALGKVHVIYANLGGKHYECTWADFNCPAPAAAEALCRSLRLKP